MNSPLQVQVLCPAPNESKGLTFIGPHIVCVYNALRVDSGRPLNNAQLPGFLSCETDLCAWQATAEDCIGFADIHKRTIKTAYNCIGSVLSRSCKLWSIPLSKKRRIWRIVNRQAGDLQPIQLTIYFMEAP